MLKNLKTEKIELVKKLEDINEQISRLEKCSKNEVQKKKSFSHKSDHESLAVEKARKKLMNQSEAYRKEVSQITSIELEETNSGFEKSRKSAKDISPVKGSLKKNFKFPPPRSFKDSSGTQTTPKRKHRSSSNKRYKIKQSRKNSTKKTTSNTTGGFYQRSIKINKNRKPKKTRGVQATLRHRTCSGIEVEVGEKYLDKKKLLAQKSRLRSENQRSIIRQGNISHSDFYSSKQASDIRRLVKNINSNRKRRRQRPKSFNNFPKNYQARVAPYDTQEKFNNQISDRDYHSYQEFKSASSVVVVEHHHLHHFVDYKRSKGLKRRLMRLSYKKGRDYSCSYENNAAAAEFYHSGIDD